MFLVLLSVACVEPEGAGPAVDLWLTDVSARTRAPGLAFTSGADGLLSASAEGAVELSVQSDGAELAGTDAADPWGVRLTTRRVGWVDGVATDIVERSPALGRCVPGAPPALDGSCLPHAELRSAGVVEFWAPRGRGYEQGFDLDAPGKGGEGSSWTSASSVPGSRPMGARHG
ncbi:MAG: hypothetical protein EXR71_15645 [Myxococcales bacterium]|nr:hypothetical protein [Myxococcales bacterium]